MTWTELLQETVALRRRLHAVPEVRWQEEKTSALLKEELTAAGISWRGCAGTGVVAYLAQGAAGPGVGLRADMDGLPLEEGPGCNWRSTHPGRMHACGHDGHMAALVGLARWLKCHEKKLACPVTLIFQPAEEGGYGARAMIEGGALANVERIFGWHNWPSIPFGKAVCPPGPVMAANGSFSITLHGRGGHASQPELCRDPVVAAAALTLNLQQIVSRRIRPQDSAVLSVTTMNAPGGETTIPDTASLRGSIRVGSDGLWDVFGNHIQSIASSTAAAYGVESEVVLTPRYPATVNDPGAAAALAVCLGDVLGNGWACCEVPAPIMASEDFSFYLRQIPGAFVLVGAGDGTGSTPLCHNKNYDFNDALLAPVIRVFSRLVGLDA